jgi:hypothetical protein
VCPFHTEGQSGYFSWALLKQVIPPVAVFTLPSTSYYNNFLQCNHQSNRPGPKTQALVLQNKRLEIVHW